MSVELNVDLSPLHTLGLRAQAARMVRLIDADALDLMLAMGEGPRRILGGGSNLVPGERVDGTVFKMELRGKALQHEDEAAWYVAAAAGENWHDFVQWTLAQGWPGLESLSLIPGTVGAAPIQNIGAYGVELKDRFHALRALDLQTGRTQMFHLADCQFAYRDSVFKQQEIGRWLILEVIFRLPKQWQPVLDYGDLRRQLDGQPITPLRVAETIMAIRRSKLPDPTELGNAGSFFHNPIVSSVAANALKGRYPGLPVFPVEGDRAKLAAGWLIEQAGWKGRCLGPVGMYEKQALVLVNHGGATANDVRALMRAVQADVHTQFGVTLMPEPVWW
ncbi:MAG: UDP-N-acetylmuramate dehydrogenase [Burkholderiales bacterium]|nr:UDP-N-acetylmuramate dehydrogenase [Burkholderiales bacterium]